MLERAARDKHSSLLQNLQIATGKSFITLKTGAGSSDDKCDEVKSYLSLKRMLNSAKTLLRMIFGL